VTDAAPAEQVPQVEAREGAVLRAAGRVVTTSGWTRDRLLARYGLLPAQVRVARPGVDRAPVAPGTGRGGALLCVAAVAPHKGHDVLLAALAAVADLPWHCACVGALDRDPAFVDGLRAHADGSGIRDRVTFTGPRVGTQLERTYAGADVLVLPSRGETYGMVVTEALARGLPVVASDVGGLPEALGRTSAGRPGLLVPPGDSAALAAALRRWLVDADLRARLHQAARQRRSTLTGWDEPVTRIGRVLTEAAAA
jgi:glycosyltransferase involved in cell wall biosynthesis